MLLSQADPKRIPTTFGLKVQPHDPEHAMKAGTLVLDFGAPMNWSLAWTVVGAATGIIALLMFFVHPSRQRRIASGGLLLVALILLVFACQPAPSPLNRRVYIESGTFDVADFLSLLSQGDVTVSISPAEANRLRANGVRINSPSLRDVPLEYVLDKIVIEQLPGNWRYEIIGMTVTLQRR